MHISPRKIYNDKQANDKMVKITSKPQWNKFSNPLGNKNKKGKKVRKISIIRKDVRELELLCIPARKVKLWDSEKIVCKFLNV